MSKSNSQIRMDAHLHPYEIAQENIALRQAAEVVVNNATKDRHGLSLVRTAAIDALRVALAASPVTES